MSGRTRSRKGHEYTHQALTDSFFDFFISPRFLTTKLHGHISASQTREPNQNEEESQ
jgi:hypothetical protein